jgi:SHS2 domain-containing protein
VRLALPQPHEDLAHTADVGVRVRGATAEEALARLALALGTLLAGLPAAERSGAGGGLPPEREERIAVRGGPGLAGTAVALLRELLFRFATERLIPCEVEVHRAAEDGAEATVGFARYDPARHAEGVDVKAVTWHAARLEPEATGWVAQAVLDV